MAHPDEDPLVFDFEEEEEADPLAPLWAEMDIALEIIAQMEAEAKQATVPVPAPTPAHGFPPSCTTRTTGQSGPSPPTRTTPIARPNSTHSTRMVAVVV